MSRQANPAVIGGFVLGALALIVVAILVLSSGSLFRKKTQVVSYFPGTVQGLSVGARVEFQGVQIGEVTAIRLDYHPEDEEFLIPVFYDVWPDSVTTHGKRAEEIAGKPPLVYLVEDRGLRARLDSVSLVTGQYMIGLSLQPGTPVAYVGQFAGRFEIPTVEATRDRVANMLQNLDLDRLVNTATGTLEAIKKFVEDPALISVVTEAEDALARAKQLIAELDAGVKPLIERTDSTLGDYAELAQTASRRVDSLADSIEQTSAEIRTLSRHIDTQVGPISNSVVGAFNSVEGLVGQGSSTRYDLDLLLKEGAGAARSLRLLADYLEQNPEALIRGRYGGR